MPAKNPFANIVFMQGRITRDPELRHTAQGKAVCNLSIANSKYSFRDGQRSEKTSYFEIVLWEKIAEYAATLRKGDDIQVEGELDQQSWDDKTTGKKQYKTQIVARRISSLNWPEDKGKPRQSTKPQQDELPTPSEPINEDEIPF